MINVRRHGAIGDGVHDDTDAFDEALSDLRGWPLYVPTGLYRLTRPLDLPNSSGRIKGDGPGMSWLVWDSGDGVVFTSSANDQEVLEISGVSFRTKGASGTALKADFSEQVQSGVTIGRFPQRFLIRNCFFWPHENASQGWNVAFDMIAGLYGVISNCNIFGRVGGVVGNMPIPASGTTGIRLRGTEPNLYDNGHPVSFRVHDCYLAYHENCIVAEGCEGVGVSGSDLVGVANGIVWDSSASGIQRPQLNVVGSHINSSNVGISAIDLADAQISTTLFYNFLPSGQPASIGIRLYGNTGSLTPMISGNTFSGITQPMNGIVVERGSYGNISNNLFRGAVTTAITLGMSSDHFAGSGNVFAPSTGTHVANSGTANSVS